MNKRLLSLLLIGGSLLLVKCGSADPDKSSPTTDTTLNKPAPDNTSATNPSLSDTGYVNKDSSKRVQNGDTTHAH